MQAQLKFEDLDGEGGIDASSESRTPLAFCNTYCTIRHAFVGNKAMAKLRGDGSSKKAAQLRKEREVVMHTDHAAEMCLGDLCAKDKLVRRLTKSEYDGWLNPDGVLVLAIFVTFGKKHPEYPAPGRLIPLLSSAYGVQAGKLP